MHAVKYPSQPSVCTINLISRCLRTLRAVMHTALVLLPRSSFAAKRLMYMAGSTIGTACCRLRCLMSFWKVCSTWATRAWGGVGHHVGHGRDGERKKKKERSHPHGQNGKGRDSTKVMVGGAGGVIV